MGNNVFHGPPPAWETSSWKLAQGPGAFERWGGRTPKQRVPRALVPNARDPWRAQHKRSALRRPDLSLTGGCCCSDLQQQPAEYLESLRAVWKIHAKACLWCHLWWLAKIWTCTSGTRKHRNTKGKNLNSAAGLDAKISQISVPSCGLRIWQRLTLDLDGAHRGIDRSAFEQYAN